MSGRRKKEETGTGGNGLFYRSFGLERAALDEDKRELELSFSSEEPVRHWFGEEILLHGESNVDLKRLRGVGSVPYGHNPWSIKNIVGPVKRAWLDPEKRQARARIGFDEDETGALAMSKIKSKSLRGVSVGYLINKARELREDEEWTDPETKRNYKGPALIATRWTPYEISFTPIPADATVGVGREMIRSLEGIEIERADGSTRNSTQEEDETMTREEFLKMLRENLPDAMEPVIEGVAKKVREAIEEERKPRMNVTVEQSRDLLARAGAVSVETKAEVADMINDGKTEPEILRFVTEKAVGTRDATDGGNLPNGTGAPGSRAPAPFSVIGSFSEIDDDTFFRGLMNPSMMPMQ